MAGPATEDMVVVGRITGCYGIKGWVKIHSYTDPGENFLRFGEWMLRRRDAVEPISFDDGRTQGKGLVAHIAGVDDRTVAESYSGLEVLVKADSLPKLEAGEYYWSQLQGLQVWCRDSTREGSDEEVLLGRVDYLIETGANDVLVVKPSTGSVDDRERLIPYLPGDVVSSVDLDRGVIEVNWFIED
ncbi:MAG: ribosome maturation factor RimM [Pseudomonadales bacterium]|nr:ribosome maturation factor RimM [Pseudomonadales bacterium]